MVSITSFQYVYQCKPTIFYNKKYRIAYFISISVFLLLERETGLKLSVLISHITKNTVNKGD